MLRGRPASIGAGRIFIAQVAGFLLSGEPILARMKLAIDDLSRSESVSWLRAAGVITAATMVTTVAFGDCSFNVSVAHRHFPNGGSWSFFVCPCGRRCRVLRLYDRSLACRWCLGASGLRPRVELIRPTSARPITLPVCSRVSISRDACSSSSSAWPQA